MVTTKRINQADMKPKNAKAKPDRTTADSALIAQRARPKSKFNPSEQTSAQTIEWIKSGDITEAANLAQNLTSFLHSYAAVRPTLLALTGFMMNGEEKRLLAALRDAKANESIRSALISLTGWLSADEAELIAQMIGRPAQSTAGKRKLSGIEQFTKILVPGKPTNSQFTQQWLASVVDLNLKGVALKKALPEIVNFLNALIDQNNKIITDWRAKIRDDLSDYNPAVPKRRVTRDQLEKAYRKYKQEIDQANGISRHKIK